MLQHYIDGEDVIIGTLEEEPIFCQDTYSVALMHRIPFYCIQNSEYRFNFEFTYFSDPKLDRTIYSNLGDFIIS